MADIEHGTESIESISLLTWQQHQRQQQSGLLLLLRINQIDCNQQR